MIDEIARDMMRLSAISYHPTHNDIKKGVAKELNGWEVVWIAETTPFSAFLVFVAKNRAGDLAVVTRGTNPINTVSGFYDCIADAGVFKQKVWSKDAKIAMGTAKAFDKIKKMECGGEKLADAIKKYHEKGRMIYVTGHSLGGGLSTVIAPWLYKTYQEDVYPITFAAPTAGNKQFATMFNQMFKKQHRRYFVAEDIVPRAWGAVSSLKKLFSNPGPKFPKNDHLINALFQFVTLEMKRKKVSYTQLGGGIELPIDTVSYDALVIKEDSPEKLKKMQAALAKSMQDRSKKVKLEKLSVSDEVKHYFAEVEFMHGRNTYLTALGAEPIQVISQKRGFKRFFKSFFIDTFKYLFHKR